MLPTFSENLTLQVAYETAALINEEIKITEFDAVHFVKNSNFLSIDFLYFFAKRIENFITRFNSVLF